MKIEEWYKERIESNTEDPPEKVWEEVQNALDLDLVWNALSTELETPGKNRKPIYWAMAASVLLLIASLGMMLFFADVFRSSGTDSVASAHRPLMISRLPSITGIQTALPASPAYPHATIVRKKHAHPGYHDLIPVASPHFSMPAFIASASTASLPANTPAPGAFPVYGDDAEPSPVGARDGGLLLASEVETTPWPGWYVGLSVQYANTWMRNEKTIIGLQNTSLVDSRPSFGRSLGFVAGKQVAERFDVKIAFDIISEKRQSYNEYLHGKFVSTGLDMDYTKLSLMAGYRFLHNKRHMMVFGMYAGYLTNAEYTVDGNRENVLHDFQKTDYGLVSGYEYTHALNRNFLLATGVYAHYGLTNVFAGGEQFPAYLNRTNFLSFHFGVSLGYLMD